MFKKTNIPNLLTLTRIALIPVVLVLFYMEKPWGNWLAATVFIAACITDYLDGYYARALKQSSSFGSILDPIADKLLVASTILMLAVFGRITEWTLIPAIIILCREILVSGLREFLAEVKISMPVTPLAKWKTGVQMTALSLLIIDDIDLYIIKIPLFLLGSLGLWVAGGLTLVTGMDYFRASLKYIKDGLR